MGHDHDHSPERDGVHGVVAPGFEPVAAAFAENLRAHGEVGAAFAASRGGELLVDLWGGRAHPDGRAWERDTIVPVFSGTKGAVALCVLMLVDRGLLELDDPIARHWPEFAAHGKGAITVAEALSHRARLPGVRAPITFPEMRDPVRMAALLADQAPETDPRAALCYHPVTYGWLAGELLRRVDGGRTLGRFLAEEVAGPLGLDLWVGLPAEQAARGATLCVSADWQDDDFGAGASPAGEPDPLRVAIEGNPPWPMAGVAPAELPPNARAWRAAESPGNGGVGAARALARMYDCLAHGGELDGVRLLSEATLRRGRAELARGVDPFGGQELAFATGFALQTARLPFGPPADAFGHGGWGGSLHAAWPEQGVGVSYAMNEMRQDDAGHADPRAQRLLTALFNALH